MKQLSPFRVLIPGLLLIVGAAPLAAQAGNVTPKAQREELLSNAGQYLESAFTPLVDAAAGIRNPFTPWIDPATLIVETPEDTSAVAAPVVVARPVQPVLPERLDDEQALSVLSAQFVEKYRPRGAFVKSQTAYLTSRDGRLLEQGSSIATTIREEPYELIVESVTTEGYTLRVGEAAREFSFNVGPPPGSIQRNP